MNKVYVVIKKTYTDGYLQDTEQIVGVFSSVEKAEEKLVNQMTKIVQERNINDVLSCNERSYRLIDYAECIGASDTEFNIFIQEINID